MCLFSEQGIYTADSDIMCYKVGKVPLNGINGIISPFELFFFEFDKLYTGQKPETIMERIDGLKIIVAGFFHAFVDERTALIKAEELRHSYNKKYKVFQAIIPKGTKYYKGLHHDICAKSIKILRDDE